MTASMINERVSAISVPVIGFHQSPLVQKFGTPRQPNLVDINSRIVMIPPYDTPDAFVGIEAFSHLWISWQFHQNKAQAGFRPQVRPPRLGGNDKLGVFATRSMYRPSQLGLSVVRLDKVEVLAGKVVLHIVGADFVDGTPIIDIKPYIAYSDSLPTAVSGFAKDKPTSKKVALTESCQLDLTKMLADNVLEEADIQNIKALVAQDPRPAYRQDEVGSVFAMQYKTVDVSFLMNGDAVFEIVSCQNVNKPHL